jgi:hypothetical protein
MTGLPTSSRVVVRCSHPASRLLAPEPWSDAGDEWLLTRRVRKIGGMGIINIIFKVKASAVLVVMCLASLSRVSASGSPLS